MNSSTTLAPQRLSTGLKRMSAGLNLCHENSQELFDQRPDLDFIFQSSFKLFNQTGGGWPLTMFLDENGVPFTGGTYFPPKEMHGRQSFTNILNQVSTHTRKQLFNGHGYNLAIYKGHVRGKLIH